MSIRSRQLPTRAPWLTNGTRHRNLAVWIGLAMLLSLTFIAVMQLWDQASPPGVVLSRSHKTSARASLSAAGYSGLPSHQLGPSALDARVVAEDGLSSGIDPAATNVQATDNSGISCQPKVTPAVSTSVTNKLYVLSEILSANETDESIGGYVRAVDPVTQSSLFSIQTGVSLDAVLSPDGTRLYVAAADVRPDSAPGLPQDQLFAIDTSTGTELWRVTLENRVKYILGYGPSTLAVSPDGCWLYVFSYPWKDLSQFPQKGYWIETVNASTGQVLSGTIPLSTECRAADIHVSPTGDTLYASCYGMQNVRAFDLRTRQVEQTFTLPMAASVLSPDGRKLYVVAPSLQVTVIDLAQQTVVEKVNVEHPGHAWVPEGQVALSADGRRLLIASVSEAGNDAVNELYVLDTQSWRQLDHVRLGQPLSLGSSLALSPDERSVFGVASSFHLRPLPDANTVLNINPATGVSNIWMERKGEVILRLFFGP